MSTETVTLYRVQANRSSAKTYGAGFTYLEQYCDKKEVSVTERLKELGYIFDRKLKNIYCFLGFFRDSYLRSHDDPDDESQPESFRVFWDKHKSGRKCIFAFQNKEAIKRVLLNGKCEEDLTILSGFLHWTLKTNNLCILEIEVLKSEEGETWISDGVVGKQTALLRKAIQSERLMSADEAIDFVLT